MLKLKVILLATAALGLGCNILGPAGPEAIADPDFAFYGCVYDDVGPVEGAIVEWWCQYPCAWPAAEVAYTNADGGYGIPGDDHEGHLVFSGAWKDGYYATQFYIEGCGPKPYRFDFRLIKEP